MVLRQGKADLIGMTRRLFADPEYANKVASGRLEDITPCTHCGNCNKTYNVPRKCRINAAFGTAQYEITPADSHKKVVVVGGGPAGMQAARISALRGHEVILYEKEHKLGGSLPLAAMIKGTEIEDIPSIIRFFKTQLKKLGVTVKMVDQFKPEDISKSNPDVVIVATGGLSLPPEMPGIEKSIVIKSSDLHKLLKFYLRFFGPNLLNRLTKFWMPVGKRVVIIGGAIQGCQLAEFLAKRGRTVTVVDTAAELGDLLAPERKGRLFGWFRRKGVTLLSGVTLEEVTDKGLTITTSDGKRQTIEVDNVIPSLPLLADTMLVQNLQGKVPEIYAIGDCNNPDIIPGATSSGWEVAKNL
jgi:2,4-dienoyl-CoA reductase (NADPH2)